MRNSTDFWRGFSAGLAAGTMSGAGAILAWREFSSAHDRRILRVESSLQIGRPVHEVFEQWSNLDNLSHFSSLIESVRVRGSRSHWRVWADGKIAEWDAELIQKIPNEALGWKSVRGPKHTGRIYFSPLQQDTLVHLTMNYAPAMGIFSKNIPPFAPRIQRAIEQVMRDFKLAMEQGNTAEVAARSTGTFSAEPGREGHMQHSRFGGATGPVEIVRPPAVTAIPQTGEEK